MAERSLVFNITVPGAKMVGRGKQRGTGYRAAENRLIGKRKSEAVNLDASATSFPALRPCACGTGNGDERGSEG